jgi:hypothetical protein
LSNKTLSYKDGDETAECKSNDGKFRCAADIISTGLRYESSIDNFLDKHQGNEYIQYCGKLAIAFVIIHAEKKSNLYVQDSSVEIKTKNGETIYGMCLSFKKLQKIVY